PSVGWPKDLNLLPPRTISCPPPLRLYFITSLLRYFVFPHHPRRPRPNRPPLPPTHKPPQKLRTPPIRIPPILHRNQKILPRHNVAQLKRPVRIALRHTHQIIRVLKFLRHQRHKNPPRPRSTLHHPPANLPRPPRRNLQLDLTPRLNLHEIPNKSR